MILHELARLRVGPHDHRDAAHRHFDPDAGDNRRQALNLCGRDPGLSDVDEERRREIQEHQPHAVDLTAIMLAGEAVRRFMDESQAEEQKPELRKVEKRLVGEVVIQRNIRTKVLPLNNEHHRFETEQKHHGEHAPPAENKASGDAVQRRQVSIRIPRREADVREIQLRFTIRPATTLGLESRAVCEILFLRRLVPEIHLIHIGGEEFDIFRRELSSALFVETCGNLVVAADTVE